MTLELVCVYLKDKLQLALIHSAEIMIFLTLKSVLLKLALFILLVATCGFNQLSTVIGMIIMLQVVSLKTP